VKKRIPKAVSEMKAEAGALGGVATSRAKVRAARENGELGGRPMVKNPNYMTLKKRESRARMAAEKKTKKKGN
jgi:hypothetical protein